MKVIDALESISRHSDALTGGGGPRAASDVAALAFWGFERQDVAMFAQQSLGRPLAGHPEAELASLVAFVAWCVHWGHPYRLTLCDAMFAPFVRRLDDGPAGAHAVSPRVCFENATATDLVKDTPSAQSPWWGMASDHCTLCLALFAADPPKGLLEQVFDGLAPSRATFLAAAPAGSLDDLRPRIAARDGAAYVGRLTPGGALDVTYVSPHRRSKGATA